MFFGASENKKFGKLSYSQCGEDLIVKHIFDTLGIKKPSYLDIGAHHPFYLSNTALFYSIGSRGINIEPDPTLFVNFLKYRKRDINLNIGIAESAGELDFYIISTPTLNTFSKDEAEKYKIEGNYQIKEVKKIQVNSIQSIINNYFQGKFPDYLTIDAEGVDELIIKSIEYNKTFPIVICLETISFSNSGNGVKNTFIIDYIKDKGYIVYADTNINTIFVKRDLWIR